MDVIKTGMLFIIILISSEQAYSQDIVDLSYYYIPVKNGEINAVEASIKLPIDMKGEYKYVSGIDYQQINISDTPLFFTNNLYKLKLPFSLIKDYGEGQQLIAVASGALSSDLKEFTINDVIISGLVAYRKKWNDYTSISYGLAYSKQFFGNQLAPIIGFDYRKNRWQLKGKFPITGNAIFDVGEKSRIGIGWRVLGTSFRFHESNWDNVYMKERSLFLAFTYYRNLNNNLGLEIATGFASQNLEFYDEKFPGWTIVTLSLGEQPEALQKWSNKGYFIKISFVLFGKKLG